MIRTGLVLLFVTLVITIQAQQNLPVRVSVFNESTSMPFSRGITTPIHPGIELGTELKWKESARFRLYPSVTLGYLYHRYLYQAFFLSAALGVDFKFKFGLNIKSSLGAGYMHTFATRQEYQFDNGTYKSKTDRGNARVIPSFSIGLGFRLKPSSSQSPEIFALYETWVEYPYSPGFIPLMAHTNVHVGYKFFPFHQTH